MERIVTVKLPVKKAKELLINSGLSDTGIKEALRQGLRDERETAKANAVVRKIQDFYKSSGNWPEPLRMEHDALQKESSDIRELFHVQYCKSAALQEKFNQFLDKEINKALEDAGVENVRYENYDFIHKEVES